MLKVPPGTGLLCLEGFFSGNRMKSAHDDIQSCGRMLGKVVHGMQVTAWSLFHLYSAEAVTLHGGNPYSRPLIDVI